MKTTRKHTQHLWFTAKSFGNMIFFLSAPLTRNLWEKSCPTVFWVWLWADCWNGVTFSSSWTNGDLETLARAAQIPHSRTSCGKRTTKSSPKSLKKSPSNSSKKDRFWMRPWHVQPDRMRKGNSWEYDNFGRKGSCPVYTINNFIRVIAIT